MPLSVSAQVRDYFVEQSLKEYVDKPLPKAVSVCNFESTNRVPIVLNPMLTLKSNSGVDGVPVSFRVKNNVYSDGKLILRRGTIARGYAEIIATQGMNGIPAMIVVDRIEIPGIDSAKLKSYYVKKGLNLTYLVLPIKWALTIFPPTGSFANFIIGGPTRLTPKTNVTVYYYPDWECLSE